MVVNCKKNGSIFCPQNLRMSQKCSTFARKMRIIDNIPSPDKELSKTIIKNMIMKKIFVLFVAALVGAAGVWAYSGEGTEGSPYLISTSDDWAAFAALIESGDSFEGKYFKLADDVSITSMWGTSDTHFKGIFDGDGHTITFERGDKMETYLAPFRYIGGATIQNVKTGGSITTSRQFTSGLVAYADGDNTITNCRASISINSGCPDDGTHGGMVANIQGGTTTITGCIYGGNMQGALTTNSGGLVGWTEGNNGAQVSLIDCIFAPASLSFKDSGSKTLARSRNTSDVTITNCFYTQKLGDEQGTKLYSIKGDVGIGVENTDAVTKEYAAAGVAFCSTTLQFNGKIYANAGTNVMIRLSGNTAYSASSGELSNNGDGTYTLIMPNENVIISGTGIPTSIEDVQSDDVPSIKFIKNGVLFIERDGKTYNAQGVEIR